MERCALCRCWRARSSISSAASIRADLKYAFPQHTIFIVLPGIGFDFSGRLLIPLFNLMKYAKIIGAQAFADTLSVGGRFD